jgi:hypothetical protein
MTNDPHRSGWPHRGAAARVGDGRAEDGPRGAAPFGRVWLHLAVMATVAGCAGAPRRLAVLDDVERVRAAAVTREELNVVPEAYARADLERDLARAAHASGDDVGATLHADRALAAYEHARAVARFARATLELADAQKSFGDATAEEASLDASRDRLDRDAQDLEKRILVARERLIPAQSAAAAPERDAARAVAARSLAAQARLLCGAARLALPDAQGLADAEREVAALNDRLAKGPEAAPIDDAAASRAHCLDALTRARRSGRYDAGAADSLLAELSAAGGWDPARDERGVTVTMREVFRGADLTSGAEAKLAELGRVAVAHPLFAVQVVIHDARPPAPGDRTDAQRADSVVKALVRAGAPAARVRAELAGALAPVVDPADAKARGRNERLEIVFVAGG